MTWLAVRVRPGADRAGALAALFALDADGVQEVGEELVTFFSGDADAGAIAAAVRSADAGAHVETLIVPEVDWTTEWKRGVRGHELGALSIVPPWLAGGRDAARTVVIEPAMAFGTGEHETTRGVVRLLADTIRVGDHVADLGSGSAVLSIAAVKLGAAHAAAIEIDPDAIGNAEENVARNGVEGRVTVIEGDAAVLLALVAPVRVVLANIISSVLLPLLPAIARALTPHGEVILGGMLEEEQATMRAALREGGWQVTAEDVEGSWWSARIARR